jgi:hypothetical protein
VGFEEEGESGGQTDTDMCQMDTDVGSTRVSIAPSHLEVRCVGRVADRYRNDAIRDVAAQDEFESKVRRRFIILYVQALSSRRYQHGYHGVNMHRPTVT